MTSVPDTHYATTADGISIAYQTVGEGPVDLVLELESWGNVEIMWELDALADLFVRLSRFSRLVLHDRRATGLSGGSSFPNLETRARDLLTVLDTIRSSRTVLFGERTTGAAFALFAASYPNRVASLVWNRAVATRRWSPDYPWGFTPDELREEAGEAQGSMGSKELALAWLEACAPSLADDERLQAEIAGWTDTSWPVNGCAVDQVESETDVTAVLPLLKPNARARLQQCRMAPPESPRSIENRGRNNYNSSPAIRMRCPTGTAPRSSMPSKPSSTVSESPTRRQPFSGRFCSPTSSVRPSARRRRVTGPGLR